MEDEKKNHQEIMSEIKALRKQHEDFAVRAEPALRAFENTTIVGNFLRRTTIGMLKFLILIGAAIGAWIAIKEFFLKK